MKPGRSFSRSAILCLTAFSLGLCAATARSAEQELPEELKKVLEHLDEANKTLEDATARVRYRRQIPLLDESEESDGKLKFKKPDLLHLKLKKPRNEEIYSTGKRWWIVSHDEKQVEVYEAAENQGNVSEASFLSFGYGQSSHKLLEDYRGALRHKRQQKGDGGEEKLTVWTLRFTPRDRDAPARFAAIEVEVASDLWLPRRIVLHESDGEIIHKFILKNISLNEGLKKKSFSYEPPKGYSVLQQN